MNIVTKINARDCVIKQLSNSVYKNFVNKYHTQKYSVANLSYGLYYKEELVQIMSFGTPRFNKNYQYEIIRECTKNNYRIRGGTSKLWAYFIKHNKVHSCICYSYPHNKTFTTHYVDYCGFYNIKKAKPQKKVYFEGEWNGEIKRIDKSILERHGVDRLLKTKQGTERTNEQILLDLGFVKKEEDGYSPQVDIYYPFSILYRVDDLDDGSFYIGMCESEYAWNNGYMGSGAHWLKHCKKYADHTYKRTILKNNFKTPAQLRSEEINIIKQYVIHSTGHTITKGIAGLMNVSIGQQGQIHHPIQCSECGSRGPIHKISCSQYVRPKNFICAECGGKSGNHKKRCSQYKIPTGTVCSECGVGYGKHKKSCSQYKDRGKCPECGYSLQSNRHAKTCSQYKPTKKCPECGGGAGKHFKSCSHYKEPKKCTECGAIHGHNKTCSQVQKCAECGGVRGRHKSTCSLYKFRKNVKQ